MSLILSYLLFHHLSLLNYVVTGLTVSKTWCQNKKKFLIQYSHALGRIFRGNNAIMRFYESNVNPFTLIVPTRLPHEDDA